MSFTVHPATVKVKRLKRFFHAASRHSHNGFAAAGGRDLRGGQFGCDNLSFVLSGLTRKTAGWFAN
jgi:hypothetical protein